MLILLQIHLGVELLNYVNNSENFLCNIYSFLVQNLNFCITNYYADYRYQMNAEGGFKFNEKQFRFLNEKVIIIEKCIVTLLRLRSFIFLLSQLLLLLLSSNGYINSIQDVSIVWKQFQILHLIFF